MFNYKLDDTTTTLINTPGVQHGTNHKSIQAAHTVAGWKTCHKSTCRFLVESHLTSGYLSLLGNNNSDNDTDNNTDNNNNNNNIDNNTKKQTTCWAKNCKYVVNLII